MSVSPSTSYRDRLNEKLFQQRTLLLTGEVDDEMAERACAELVLLASADPERDIILYINSPGGSVLAGLAIYDTMKLVPNDVVTVALGMAASMGQVLLASGTHGKRISLAHSRIMMHQPSAGIGGTAIDISIQAENLKYMKRQSEEILAAETGRTIEEIAADSDRDRWFTPEEARDYGMIDTIVDSFHNIAPYAVPNRMGFSS
ncbi:ClpP family protease [Microbispora bryophytorum]|uniref:ATP-dependent Clp protease proteolytic subunit n=1 Tax=Microbispora bryophytorum TaxID=1460882 RepID=A0A8H9GZZ3_9ACTN|nr:ATP-dependent Clp protease proteolytic subunit [Microbispora bryophytorum]MBD3139028.1 ATP-dependent Clp protease proteolytic subunit [Microbispora bryophytorum]TQS03106.1 ATP-dependent Clp protease proteolytic subunit [Microbispora bryophytorum]GGO09666.1 ATP-dependent Clp protease proteolytic subunit 3 [Microbispora bryophytorum]